MAAMAPAMPPPRSLDQTKRPDEDDATQEPRLLPSLRALYSKEEGILIQPARILDPGTIRLGRGVPVREICLANDGQASREHAAISVQPGQPPRVRDLCSSNGTFVNGAQLGKDREVPLRDGDLLRVGSTLLLFRLEPDALHGAADEPVKGLLGQSPAMRQLRRELRLVGPSLATVLLLGESGTGKEVTAQALHALSGVKGPMVAVNCAAIPESLAESQLFGHVAGAFTGAKEQPGYFRAAHGGTLFLDEVGELPSVLQPKLLRALEEGTVTPVGSVTPLLCRIRLIAATNRDLGAGGPTPAVRPLRGDLFARLAEIVLKLPPLRERREDILLILREVLGPSAPPLSPKLAEALLLHPWPFNVRELGKVATELRVRGSGQSVLGLDLVAERLRSIPPAEPRPEAPEPQAADESQAARAVPLPDRAGMEALLRQHQGKVSAVAQALQRSRTQTYRLLEQLQLDPENYRRG
jgi:DNA-binding NtrC family response regulator